MAGKSSRSWWQRLPFQVLLLAIVGAAAAFILLWWLLPPLLYASTAAEDVRVKAITDTRTALLAGLVGLGALGTFWVNSRTYRITARTFEVTERGHVTDRYSGAIEQLGKDSLDVRLGGIYSLEQIAKESARAEEDQATIVEVLSAFVRVHSNPTYQLKAAKPGHYEMSTDEEYAAIAAEYVKDRKPPVDVQAAVTVLGRLRHLDTVPRADLTGATLRHAALHRDLIGATLVDSDLTGADLSAVKLSGADLTGAKLHKTKLGRADLTEAKLRGADLTEADLREANLTRADLIWRDARWVFTGGTILTEADLRGADLTEADLRGAKFGRAKLSKATLSKAKLAYAALRGADLTGADLTGADLLKADFSEAGLREAKVTQAQLARAQGNHETLLPEGLSRPSNWKDEQAAEDD